MKKIASLLAGMLLIAMILTSCGDSIQMPPSDTGAFTDTDAETNASGDTNTESTPGTTPGTSDVPGEDSEHTHTFVEYWTSDENQHWHTSSCGHDVKDAAADHVDENGDDVCDICGHRKDHVHTYEDTWTISERTHYYKNTCGHDDVEKYRKDEAAHADADNNGLCDVCAYDYGHTHTYDTENWTLTEGGHWHAPTCGHDVPGIDLVDHADADNNGICDGCGYDYDHTHTWSENWTYDDDYHWHDVTCGHSIDVADKNAHVAGDDGKTCSVCGYQPPHIHEFDKNTWTSDANGHWHASTCGHDVRADEAGHDGHEQDGVCDTCGYVVFHFYTVTVTLPEEGVSIKAPDGSDSLSFVCKEGTDVVFELTLPRYIEIINMKGATRSEKSVVVGDNHTYTVTVPAIKADTDVTMELKKNANVQVIVDNAAATLENVVAWNYTSGQLTFHIPADGRYIIYSPTVDLAFSSSDTGVTVSKDDYSRAYILDTKAGDITLDYKYFAWNAPADGKLDFTYVVARVEKDTTLDTLEGNGCIMPTNYAVNISFKLPATGFYQVISSYEVTWNGDLIQPYFFYVPEGGELERTISIRYDSETESTFTFDWKIEKLDPAFALTMGENTFVAEKGAYTAMTFTAPYDGDFYFTTGDQNAIFYQWSSEYEYLQRKGSSPVIEGLTKGETITLYVITDPYAAEGVITGNINCTGKVAYVPVKDTDGFYNAVVGAENVIELASGISAYALYAVDGDSISIDGGATWHTSVTFEDIQDGLVSFLVQSGDGDGIAQISDAEVKYEFDLTVGENTFDDLIPGQQYTVTLSGADSSNYYLNYILSWTDADIEVVYMGQDMTSGGDILSYSAASHVYITYNGEAGTAVTFTLAEGDNSTPEETDPEDPDPEDPDPSNPTDPVEPDNVLTVGETTFEIEDYGSVQVSFTAETAGTYILSCTTNNAAVAYESAPGTTESLTLPYTFTLEADETITFTLGTADWMAGTVVMKVEKA